MKAERFSLDENTKTKMNNMNKKPIKTIVENEQWKKDGTIVAG